MYATKSHQNSTIPQTAETGLWPTKFLFLFHPESITPAFTTLSKAMQVFFIKPSVYAVQ